MGPGHLGVGFAAKTVAPKAPLWSLLAASEALDLLSGVFIAVGSESMAVSETSFREGLQILTPGSIPWSHGLFMALVWSLLASLLAWRVSGARRTAVLLGLLVFSHWIIDFISHPMTAVFPHDAGLPLFFAAEPLVGLGVWRTQAGVTVGEYGVLALGLTIYLLARRRQRHSQPTIQTQS